MGWRQTFKKKKAFNKDSQVTQLENHLTYTFIQLSVNEIHDIEFL